MAPGPAREEGTNDVKARKQRRGPFRVGDQVVSHSGSVHGRIVSDDGADLRVREHGRVGGVVVGRRRYWHHDPDGPATPPHGLMEPDDESSNSGD
jgi:hypothetical protein